MEGKIRYVKYCATKRDYKTVSHADLNGWTVKDFERNGLYEELEGLENVRLYFDFDLKDSETIDLDGIFKELNRLAKVFNEYYFAGYCTDEGLYNTLNSNQQSHIELKKEKLDKVLSFHVVYPDTTISQKELLEIMNDDVYEVAIKSVKGFDGSVYRKNGKGSLLRHPFAHKYRNPYEERVERKGVTIKNTDASDLVVTPTGMEDHVTREQWLEVFPMKKKVSKVSNKTFYDVVKALNDKNDEGHYNGDEDVMPEDVSNDMDSVDMSLELFEALYKGFEGLEVHGDAGNKRCDEEITLVPLLSAIYKCQNDVIDADVIDDAIDFIKENANLTRNARAGWSDRRKQARANKTCRGPGALFVYLKTFNAEYFNSTVKPLMPKRAEDLNDIEFDLKDSFSISDIRSKGAKGAYQVNGDAEKLDYNAVLNDLRRCMLVVDKAEAIYVFKERDARNSRMTTNCYKLKTARDMLMQLKVGTEAKDDNKKNSKTIMRSAWDVYNASTNNAAFYKRDITFYSTDKDDFSFFQGYKYEQIQNDALIEAFNHHIKHIWCKDNEECYNYIQDWFTTVIQKPLGRARTAIVVKGIEGTGKNTITDVWCELLAGYANPNVSDMDSIAGKFNTSLENKKLLVCNEMNSVELSGANLHNSLKKLITEDHVDIHTKNMSVRNGVQNAANFVFLSNEFNPVKVTGTDRRYFIITPSEEVAGNDDYFDKLYDIMKDEDGKYRVEFMNALMYYYMNRTITTNLKKIPDTDERVVMMDVNKGAIESFVEEYCDELSGEGIPTSTAFEQFKKFVSDNGFKYQCKKTTFGAEMSKYCKMHKNGKYQKPAKNKSGVSAYMFTNEFKDKYKELVPMKREEHIAARSMNVIVLVDDEGHYNGEEE